jgi:oligosaccharide amylase
MSSNRQSYLADGSWPWLYSAVLGNGRLLACLDENGSLAQLFYPRLDVGPHVHSFLIGVQILSNGPEELLRDLGTSEQGVLWLASTEWTHKLSYMDGAAVAHCVSTHPTLSIQVDQAIFVHHNCDAFINEIKCSNLGNTPFTCRLVIFAGFDFDYRQTGQTCYYNADTSSLTFFAGDRYVAITCDKPVDGFDCERGLDALFQNVSSGQFHTRVYAFGRVCGAVRYNLGQIDAGNTTTSQMYISFGESFDDLVTASTLLTQSQSHVEETARWWQERYIPSVSRISSKTIRNVYNRSLITLNLLTDSQTGGIIAAPECDPGFTSCGGYGFCWPRDGAFIGYALDTVGQHDHARLFYDWALRTQEASGGWYQRYYMHGALAPTWGLVQFDEVGAVVWSICRHIQQTEDLAYGQKVFLQLTHACEYMQKELDAETGLAPITWDLWEEREGISTYACACTWAAFNAFAHLSTSLGLAAEGKQWAVAATQLKQAIEKHLWDASQQRFLRGIKTRIPKHLLSNANIATIGCSEQALYMPLRDMVVDTSILGLSIPFGVFPASDPRMIATAEVVAKHLTSPVGGIVRYEGDQYRGRNPWIICTLWLALQYINSERKEQGYQLYNWALEHRTSLDLFSEQIDLTTGKPCWVTPLAWSHAMFLLVTEECMKHGLLE